MNEHQQEVGESGGTNVASGVDPAGVEGVERVGVDPAGVEGVDSGGVERVRVEGVDSGGVDPAGVDPATVKQVIVIRRDLHMRRGKEIAQGSHASGAWLARVVTDSIDPQTGVVSLTLDDVAIAWLTGSFRKVTLQVQTEAELVELHAKAEALGLRSVLIRDSGKTEFGGVPTVTALGIGPDLAASIDEVTGHLGIY